MQRSLGIFAVLLALAGGAATAQEAQQQPPGSVLTTPELAPVPGAPAEATGNGTGPALLVETPEPRQGQNAPQIMTIDPEAVFARSRWGLRVQTELDRRGREIAAENDRLANQFSAEEQQLTTLRATLSAEEFRKRADEFDQRVVEVRRARDGVARDLQEEIDEERAAFFRAALPVLAQLMKERGATVVLDQRAIFVSAQSADVTDALIERCDEVVGAGPAAPATDEGAKDSAPEGAKPSP